MAAATAAIGVIASLSIHDADAAHTIPARRGRHATLRGAVGNGPAVEIQTERGQIVVGKAVPGDTTQVLKKLEQ